MTNAVDLQALKQVVCAEQSHYPAAVLCCESLGSIRPDQISERSDVPLDELRVIYRVRLGTPRPGVELPEGSGDLLERLESASGPTIRMFLWEVAGKIHGVLLNEAGTKLIACTVGRDRRVLDIPGP